MNKYVLSVVLAILVCSALFPLPAAASSAEVTATYAGGVVTVGGTGFVYNIGYTVRVVDTVGSGVKAMGQATADKDGKIAVSITTGVLKDLKNYTVYVNKPDGTLAGTDAAIEGSTVLYSAAIRADTGGIITSGASGSYAAGTVIHLAARADNGYSFSKWTSDGGSFANANSATTTFTMSSANVTITAHFTYNSGSETPPPTSTPPTSTSPVATPPPATGITVVRSGNMATVSTAVSAPPDPSTGINIIRADTGVIGAMAEMAKKETAPGQETVVEIKAEATEGARMVEVVIPKEDFRQIADAAGADLRIYTGIGTITLDVRALAFINASEWEGEISFVIRKMDSGSLSGNMRAIVGARPVYDIYIKTGDTEITDFGGGKAQVTIPFYQSFGARRRFR